MTEVAGVLMNLIIWACINMGMGPEQVILPNFKPVTLAQMQKLVCAEKPDCIPGPTHFAGKEYYYITNVPWWKNQKLRSYAAHEMVHYMQYLQTGRDMKVMKEYFKEYEMEALRLQELYLEQITI